MVLPVPGPSTEPAHSPHSSRRVYIATILLLHYRPYRMTAKSGTPAPAAPSGRVAGNSPVYGPGWKLPLVVAQEVAGNSGCRILGRILYISYSSTPCSCVHTGPEHLPRSAV